MEAETTNRRLDMETLPPTPTRQTQTPTLALTTTRQAELEARDWATTLATTTRQAELEVQGWATTPPTPMEAEPTNRLLDMETLLPTPAATIITPPAETTTILQITHTEHQPQQALDTETRHPPTTTVIRRTTAPWARSWRRLEAC